MFAKIGEQPFLSEGRHLRKNFKTEVASLEFALSEVAPLGEGKRPSVIGKHRQRVTMHEILGQNVRSGQIKLICLIQIQVIGKDLKHVRAALNDVVW